MPEILGIFTLALLCLNNNQEIVKAIKTDMMFDVKIITKEFCVLTGFGSDIFVPVEVIVSCFK